MIQEKSWINQDGRNADPGLFLGKRHKTFWLSRKSPGTEQKGVTPIQDFSMKTNFTSGLSRKKSWENKEGPNADPGHLLDKWNKTSWLSRKSPRKTQQGVTLMKDFSRKNDRTVWISRKRPGKMKKDLTLIQDFSWISETTFFDDERKSWKNKDVCNAHPRRFLEKRNRTFWISRKSSGTTQKGVTLIQVFSGETKQNFLIVQNKSWKNEEGSNADPGHLLDEWNKTVWLSRKRPE